jgi:hypothetical protein
VQGFFAFLQQNPYRRQFLVVEVAAWTGLAGINAMMPARFALLLDVLP